MHTHIYEGFRSHGAARLSSGEARAQEAIRRAQQEQAAISPFFLERFLDDEWIDDFPSQASLRKMDG
jgi:hypothetical protein